MAGKDKRPTNATTDARSAPVVGFASNTPSTANKLVLPPLPRNLWERPNLTA